MFLQFKQKLVHRCICRKYNKISNSTASGTPFSQPGLSTEAATRHKGIPKSVKNLFYSEHENPCNVAIFDIISFVYSNRVQSKKYDR